MLKRADIRRILWRWGSVMDFCRSRQREMEEFQQRLADCTSLSAQVLDGMPHGTDTSNPTQRAAERLVGVGKRYERIIEVIQQDIDAELKLKNDIDKAVAELPYEQQKILELRYKEKHQWVYIAQTMCFDERWVRRLEERAIIAVGEKLNLYARKSPENDDKIIAW